MITTVLRILRHTERCTALLPSSVRLMRSLEMSKTLQSRYAARPLESGGDPLGERPDLAQRPHGKSGRLRIRAKPRLPVEFEGEQPVR